MPTLGPDCWWKSLTLPILDLVRLTAWNPPPSELYIARCPIIKQWKNTPKKTKKRRQETDESTKHYTAKWCFCFSTSMASNSMASSLPCCFWILGYLMGLLNSFGCSASSWQVKKTHGVSKTSWHVSIAFSGEHGLLFRHVFWNPSVDSWFHLFFTFTPICCEVIQFDGCIFFQNGVGEQNPPNKPLIFCLFGLVKNLRSPKGILHFIADISGWWNLYSWESETWPLKWT